MPDKKEIVLQKCKNAIDCGEPIMDYHFYYEVIDLLKEQEAVEPTVSGIEEYDGHSGWWYQCGKCKMPIDYRDRFCRHCGQAVQWT